MRQHLVEASSPEQIEEKLAEIREIPNYSIRAEQLIELAAGLLPSRTETLRQAFTLAQTLKDPFERAEFLVEHIQDFSQLDADKVIEVAIELVNGIENDKFNFSRLLTIIALQISNESKRHQELERAWLAAKRISVSWKRAGQLSEIVPHLCEENRQQALKETLTSIHDISNEKDRADALKRILPCLSENLLQQTLNTEKNIEESQTKGLEVYALAAISSYLPNEDRHPILQEILRKIRDIHFVSARTTALVTVIPQLPENLLGQAWTISKETDHNLYKLQSLLKVQEYLSDDEDNLRIVEDIVTAAKQLRHPSTLEDLVKVISSLPENDRSQILEQAVEISKHTGIKENYVRNLIVILPYLRGGRKLQALEQAINIIRIVSKETVRSSQLVDLLFHIPSTAYEFLDQAYDIAQSILDAEKRFYALESIATREVRSKQLYVLTDALNAANSIDDKKSRCTALIRLSNLLGDIDPSQLLDEALSLIPRIEDEYDRCHALEKIVPQLPENSYESALNICQSIQKEKHRAKSLIAIASHMPQFLEELLERGISIAQHISTEDPERVAENRAKAIAEFAVKLPSEKCLKAFSAELEFALTSDKKYVQVQTLVGLSSKLPSELLLQALRLAKSTLDRYKYRQYDEIINSFFPRLPSNMLSDEVRHELEEIKKIDDFGEKARLLAVLIPLLPEKTERNEIIEQILTIVKAIEGDFSRNLILQDIAPLLLKCEPQALDEIVNLSKSYQAPKEQLVLLEKISSQVVLANLETFLEFSLELSQYDTHQVAKALAFSASRYTEDFVLAFPKEKHSLALECIKHIGSDATKCQFLSALVPHMLKNRLTEASDLVVYGLKDDRFRAEAFSNILRYLPESDLISTSLKILGKLERPASLALALEVIISTLGTKLFTDRNREIYSKVTSTISKLDDLELKIQSLYFLACEFQKEEKNRKFNGGGSTLYLRSAPTNFEIASYIFDAAIELYQKYRNIFFCEKVSILVFQKMAPSLRRFKEYQFLDKKEQQIEIQDKKLNKVIEFIGKIEDIGFRAQIVENFPREGDFMDFRDRIFPFSTVENSDSGYLRMLWVKSRLPFSKRKYKFVNDNLKKVDEGSEPYAKTDLLVEASIQSSLIIPKEYLIILQEKSLVAIRRLSNPYLQFKSLKRIISRLYKSHYFDAVSIIGDIQDPYYQASAYVAIAQKFPDIEFFNSALSAIEVLASQTSINHRHKVQALEQLSTLALKTPDILPKMIRASEDFFVDTKAERIDADGSKQVCLEEKVARHDILTILAPHLPTRINNEVVRERSLGHFASRDLYQRSLFLLKIKYRKVLKNEVLRNDAAQAEDLLNLKSEINSLSGLLLRRDLEPPMTLAVFGSWGSGKSYIMYLMQECMTEIRSRPVSQTEAWSPNPEDPKLSPFVGHIYQIRFDAWTFAKSDIWASLMQTIFFELDRQLTLESAILRALAQYKETVLEQHKLAFVNRAKEEALKGVDNAKTRECIEQEYAFDQRKGKELLKEYENSQDIQDERKQIAQSCENKKQDVEARIWPVLYKSNNEEREWFLNRVLQDSKLLDLMESEPTQGGLWQVIDKIQKKDKEILKKIRLQLGQAQNELDKKRAQCRQDAIDEFEPILNFQKNQQVRRIDALFGTSFEILRRRIGPKLFLELNKQVHVELYGPESIKQDGIGKPTQTSFNSALEFLRASGSGNNIDNTSIQNNTSTPQEPITDSTQKAPAEVDKGLWGKLNNLLADVEDAKEKLRKLEQEETAAPKEQQSEEEKKNQGIIEQKQEIENLLRDVGATRFSILDVATSVIEKNHGKIMRGMASRWVRRNWIPLLLSIVFTLIIICLLILYELNPSDSISWVSRLATLIAPTLPSAVLLRNMFRSGAAWFEETQLALKEYEKSVERKNKQREERIEAIVEQRIEANEELRQLEDTVQRLKREAQEQEALIPVNQYASLADFVSGRIEAETYKRHLGLMQQVQEDLQALSYKLLPPSHYDPRFKTQIDNLQQVFPRGPVRVVVYIDDLDRCPPQRVVEVLEAIQLLVKTPLFIAVIAIDERYMIRALERHYDGMLLKVGSPSCTDYLEKIIQIHYRVRPVSSNILESYLRSQFVLQDLDLAEAENNELSREEFTMLVNACRVSNLSPRTLKRISNTYKVFKTFCRIRYLQLTPEVQKAIFALLSLSSEYPDLMRDILKKIDSNYEKGEEHKLLQECIIDYPLPYSNQYLEHRLEQLKEDAQREFEYGQWKKATIRD